MFDNILSSLGSLSSMAAGLIPGAGPAIQVGKALIDAFKTVKEANGGTAPASAETAHQALVAKVNAHADETFGRLDGEDNQD